MNCKKDFFYITAIIFLGAAIRVAYGLDRSYVGDEIGTLFYIKRDYLYILSHFKTWLSMNYYIAALKGLTQIFGDNQILLLSLSILPGIATLPISWIVARKYFNQTTANIVIALVAFNPVLIEYSSVMRAYALLVFMALFSLQLLRYWLANSNLTRAALLSLAIILMILSHPMGVYPLFFICYEAARVKISQHKINAKQLLKEISFLVLIVLFSGSVILLLYSQIIPEMLVEGQKWRVPFFTDVSYIPYALNSFFGEGLIVLFSIFFIISGFFYIFKDGSESRTLVIFLLLPIAGISFQGLSHFPWGYTRFLLYLLPVLIFFLAEGIRKFSLERFKSTPSQKYTILISILILISWLPMLVVKFEEKLQLRWREAAIFLKTNLSNEDIIAGMSWSEPFHLSPYGLGIDIENYARLELNSQIFQNSRLNPRTHIYLVQNGMQLKTRYQQHVFGDIQIIDYYGKDYKSILEDMRREMIESTEGGLMYGAQYTQIYKSIWEIGNYLGITINQDYFYNMWQKNALLLEREQFFPLGLRLWDIRNTSHEIEVP